MTDLPTDGWMIAQIKPGGTATARRNLDRQGFAVFMPGLAVTRRLRGKPVPAAEPLFHGYLFVLATDDSAPPARIASTLGISRLLLRSDRAPATLPPDFIAALLARTDAQGLIIPETALAPGDRVRIRQGAFADQVTTIESLGRDGRVAVLIGLLGQQVRVSLSPADLRRD
jgi:transcriptional antiterminator RfaH